MADLNRNGEPRVYLDWNATAPPLAAAQDAMREEGTRWANPSSIHAEGRAARGRLEDYRQRVAKALGVAPRAVVFTSGGTEALQLALEGARTTRHLVGATEHDAVRSVVAGAETIPVDADGAILLDALRERLRAGPALVSVMHANNEVGTLQPVEDIREVVREAGGLFLCDCVQTTGKLPLPEADFIALSAHKLGGPPGVGVLLVNVADQFAASRRGGGQERGLRGGTENLPGIAGLAAALDWAKNTRWLGAARERHTALEERLRIAGGDIVGVGAARLGNVTMVRMPGVTAAAQLMHFDLAGFAVSSGSACSSGKVGSSHVLKAMGFSEVAAGEAIRISSGWSTGSEELESFADAWTALAERRRAA